MRKTRVSQGSIAQGSGFGLIPKRLKVILPSLMFMSYGIYIISFKISAGMAVVAFFRFLLSLYLLFVHLGKKRERL